MSRPDPRLVRAFSPRSVAVVGATDDRNKVGGRPLHYLQRFGFAGAIYPVNPNRSTVQGLPAWPSVDALPAVPDTAVVAVGAAQAPAVLQACAAAGITSAIVLSSGFGETGADGLRRQQALVDAARAAGLRLVGPNAQGLANFATGAVLNFSTMFMEVAPQDGPVAILSQSGAASVMPYAMLRERGIGVRYLAASGNDADASVCELALAAAADPEVRVLLLYIESLRDTASLAEAARVAQARGAAVIALKSGRSARGAQAAASHTGALVDDDAAVDAFLEHHGIWRAPDVHGLVNAVELLLAGGRPSPDGRLVVMSHSGAVGVLCADAAEAVGLPLAELSPATTAALAGVMPGFATAANPLDLTAALLTEGGLFAHTLEVLATDPQAGAYLVGVPVAGEGYDVPGMARDAAALARRTGRPVAVSAPQAAVRAAFRATGVPVFGHESDAIAALHTVHALARLQARAAARARAADDAAAAPLPAGDGRFLDEAQSLALAEAAGVPVAPHRVCASADEAVAAWRELGPEVVVKACAAALPHKSEHGLVLVGVTDEAGVRAAHAQCVAKVGALGARLDGVIVARRVRGRREFALGARHDERFGTVVMVGDGGKYVEALRDVAVLLHPFDAADVEAALQRLRIAPLLAGVRGEPPLDTAAIASAAIALGRLVASQRGAIASVDLNPLIVGARGEGGWAADAVVERAATGARDGQ